MADDSLKYYSEEELFKKLQGLTVEERTEVLKKLGLDFKSLDEFTKKLDKNPRLRLDSKVSEALIIEDNAIKAKIESGESSLDTSTVDNTAALAKSLSVRLRLDPNTAKRYHFMRFKAQPNTFITGEPDTRFMFIINESNFNNSPSGFDEVISLEDVSVGAPFTGTTYSSSNGNNTVHRIYFLTSEHPTGEITKIIRVNWLSGYTKDFTFKLKLITPTINTSLGTYPYAIQNGGGGWIGHNAYTSSCALPYDIRYRFLSAYMKSTHTQYVSKLTIGEPLVNPSGNFEYFEFLLGNFPAPAGTLPYKIISTGIESSIDWPTGTLLNKYFNPNPNFSGEQLVRFTEKTLWEGGATVIDNSGNEFSTLLDFNSFGGYTYNPSAMLTNADETLLSSSGNLYTSAAQFRSIENSRDDGWYMQSMVYADNLPGR